MSDSYSILNLLIIGAGSIALFMTAMNKNKWNLFLFYLVIMAMWLLSFLVFTPFVQALIRIFPGFLMLDEEDLNSALNAPVMFCMIIYLVLSLLFYPEYIEKIWAEKNKVKFFWLVGWVSPFIAKIFLPGVIGTSAFLILLFIIFYYSDPLLGKFSIKDEEDQAYIGNPAEIALVLEDLVNKIEQQSGLLWDNYFIRGNIFFRQKRYTEAEWDFNAVIRSLQNEDIDSQKRKYLKNSYLKIAMIRSKANDWIAARDLFNKSKNYSDNPETYFAKIADKLMFDVLPFNYKTVANLIFVSFIWGYVQWENGGVDMPTEKWMETLQGQWFYEANAESENGKTVSIGNVKYDAEENFIRDIKIYEYKKNWLIDIYEALRKGNVGNGNIIGIYKFKTNDHGDGAWVELSNQCNLQFNPSYSGIFFNKGDDDALCKIFASGTYGYESDDNATLWVKQFSQNKIIMVGIYRKTKGSIKITFTRMGGVNSFKNAIGF